MHAGLCVKIPVKENFHTLFKKIKNDIPSMCLFFWDYHDLLNEFSYILYFWGALIWPLENWGGPNSLKGEVKKLRNHNHRKKTKMPRITLCTNNYTIIPIPGKLKKKKKVNPHQETVCVLGKDIQWNSFFKQASEVDNVSKHMYFLISL